MEWRIKHFSKIVLENEELRSAKENIPALIDIWSQKQTKFKEIMKESEGLDKDISQKIRKMIGYLNKNKNGKGAKRFYILQTESLDHKEDKDEMLLWAEGIISKSAGKGAVMTGRKKVISELGSLCLGNCEVLLEG